jgi:hypothetical protein
MSRTTTTASASTTDLVGDLLTALHGKGITATVKWANSGYGRIIVDGRTAAYVQPVKAGLRVEAGISPDKLPSRVNGFRPARFGVTGTFDTASMKHAVAAVAAAAAARPAKAATAAPNARTAAPKPAGNRKAAPAHKRTRKAATAA